LEPKQKKVSRFTQDELIDGLRRRDNRVLRFIYVSYYPLIQKLIKGNSGNEHDAEDIFQESLIVLFNNIRETSDFSVKSDLQTYVYSIARLLWLKKLRRDKVGDRVLKESHPYIDFEEPKPFDDGDLRYALYQKAFLDLPADCQQILRMTNEGASHKEIADLLGFNSDNYIKKRKHYCKEFLVARIKEMPDYQNLKDD